jgi:hypothetical protein
MNESPTNHALKYSQAVNVKSIPVQADISDMKVLQAQLVPY